MTAALLWLQRCGESADDLLLVVLEKETNTTV
jgi:hypothetical protein